MIYGWSPGIGDPDLLGWMTVAAYLAAAMLCGRAARYDASARRFWIALAVLLIALGINKQLDLQSLLTAIGRHVAQVQGWYGERRGWQRLFIVAVALGGGVGAVGLVAYLRGRDRAARLAGLGCMALIAFVVIRAASFEKVDTLLAAGIAGVRVNHLLELGGIATIAVAALLANARSR